MKRNSIREKRWSYITDEDYAIAAKNGICKTTVYSRVNAYGMDIDTAITKKPVGPHEFRADWDMFKDIASVGRYTFYSRKKAGWSTVRAALLPALSKKEVAERNRKFSKEDLERAAKLGITRRLISYRMTVMGMSFEEAITMPKMSKSEAGKMRYAKGRKNGQKNRVS